MEYVKVLPPLTNTIRFTPQPLLAKLRRDEWLQLTATEAKVLCGVKGLKAAYDTAVKRGAIKQKVVITIRHFNTPRQTWYVRLY